MRGKKRCSRNVLQALMNGCFLLEDSRHRERPRVLHLEVEGVRVRQELAWLRQELAKLREEVAVLRRGRPV